VYKHGEMVQNILGIGLKIRHEVMEDWFMQMEMYIKEIGKMIKQMVLEFIHI